MNSRQRILAATNGELPDRLPCSPHVTPRTVADMRPDEWDAILHQADPTLSVGLLGDMEIFGGQACVDGTRVLVDGDRSTVEIETPKGILRSRQLATSEATWHEERFGKSDDDIDKILSIPYAQPQVDTATYDEWREAVGDDGLVSVGIPSAFRFCLGFFGPQGLYERMGDDVDSIARSVVTSAERVEVYAEACCRQGVRHFWMGGAEHCGPGVVNPKLFSRLVTPYDKRIVRIIHDYGGTVNYHVHAKLKEILDDIAEIGVDVLSPIETGLRGDVTLAEAKDAIGDRVCLKGNLDDMAFLALVSEQEVREAARDCVRQAAEGGRYILSGTDATIYDPRWAQNFMVMAQVARDYVYQ